MMLRDANENDIPAILEIMNEAILNSTAIYDYHPRTQESVGAWFQKKTADGLPVIVSETDGVVAGFASYGIFRPWDGYRFTAEHSIYIARDVRGKGTGSYLMRALIDRAQQQGFHTLIAGIDAGNESSIAFHKKYGFEEVGRFREVGYKFERWLDLVFMQLMLEPTQA